MTQRQDQLERQRETATKVDGIKMDVYTSTRSVDRRMESLRRDVDWKFEWRVKKAWSRPEIQFLRC